jgi:Protein of unknown function (DUF3667)
MASRHTNASRDSSAGRNSGLAHSPWACPSCRYVESPQARYCSNCGEARLLQGAGADAAGSTPVWRRWADTLALLLRHPGQLTRDHLRGRRRHRTTPAALLLAAHAAFAAALWWAAPGLLRTPLAQHLQGQGMSAQGWPATWATGWVQARLVASTVPVERYAERFDVLQPVVAVATLTALLPLWLLAAAAVHHGPRQRWPALWVTVQHLLALLLLWAAGLLVLGRAALAAAPWLGLQGALAAGAEGLGALQPWLSVWTLAGGVTAAVVYLTAGRVFGNNAPRQALCAAVLLAAGVLLLALHRVLVFAATAWVL